jgi:outer membrane protein OmpA-like peptidoglycan-associated protein
MLYIIASPFDNWYINVGGGIQTFMGNELEASARHNKLNFNLQGEIGKWIIPDVAVSARFSIFNVDGQSQYGQQPFIDKLNDTPNENGYFPFHAYAASLIGYVTLDWTNFLSGYERGKRNKLHIFTPIGLGASVLFGPQRNPRGNEELGSFRRNFELAYSGGIGAEYEVTQELALSATIELFGSESTWDWSPYDNSYSRFDIIPSFNIRARFNLLKNVTKYNPYTKNSSREKVNHEFLSFGTRNTIPGLNGRIERLTHEIDSIQNLSDQRGANDSAMLAGMNKELENLQDRLDSLQSLPYRPINVLDELIQMNEVMGLPSTIVYFQLDRYELDYNGRKRLQNFAKELNALDDTVEFYIVGAADSATGTIRHNLWLSERRCEAAYNMLVDHFGVDGNQLIMVPVGGITDYDPQENNRMAMVILRTPVTEEIIDRWMRKRQK